MARVPRPVRSLLAGATPLVWKGQRREKAVEFLRAERNGWSSYELLRRLFLPREVSGLSRAATNGATHKRLDRGRDLYAQLSVLELTGYMKNVLLRDTDAVSMANSLEVRVPFLDQPLVEWVLRLPPELKRGKGKALLLAARRTSSRPRTSPGRRWVSCR